MEKPNFILILTQPDGTFAIPDIEITDDFETTFSIESSADISLRKDSLSKNISFPGTKNNNRIFNNLFSLNRQSNADFINETLYYNYSPNIGVRAVLYENNYPQIAGTLKINEVVKDKKTKAYRYTGAIRGNVVSFFGKISDLKLTDLSGFDETILYDWNSIVNSWYFTPDQKFFFPQIDFGNGIKPNPANFDFRNFRPAIYARQFIKFILASQGYKYKSQFIDSDLFNRAFIPFQETGFGSIKYGNFVTISGGGVSTPLNRPRPVRRMSFAGTFYDPLELNDFIEVQKQRNITWDTQALGDYSSNSDVFRFKTTTETALSFTISLRLESRRAFGKGTIALVAINPASGRFSVDNILASKDYDFTVNSVNNDTVTLDVSYRNFPIGYCFALVCMVQSNDTVDFDQKSVSGKFGNPDASVGSLIVYELGDTFKLSEAVPKEQIASDFLKSILQLFNMYMIENPDNDNEFIIEPYDVFYLATTTPQPYALDWTKKVDQSSLHIKINNSLPKVYNFKFKEDSDFYNTLYKNRNNAIYGNFSINNKNGSVDAKNLEVVFSPTVIVREDGDTKTMPSIFSGDISNKKSYKSNLRILYNNGVAPCSNYKIVQFDAAGNNPVVKVNNVSTCQQSHHVLNLDGTDKFNLLFGIPLEVFYPVTQSIFNLPTLYSTLYKNQIAELNDENIFTLELDCHLNEIDISNLDLRTPIFIATEQGAAYFKVMNVNYYSSKEVSKVVLQKIII